MKINRQRISLAATKEAPMDLYFSPMACSMATRIALYEAGAEARFFEIDPPSKTLLQDGSDFRVVNPLGLVPTLRTDDGLILTENAAILQHVAERFPDSPIAAGTGIERTRLQQWLCFIGTELHKSLFQPLLSKKAPPEAKAYALENGCSKLDYLDKHLAGRDFLLDRFSVADAYLSTVLNWTLVIPQLDLDQWPAIKAYHAKMRERPSVMRAVGEEFELFKAEQARHRVAA
jgi:glutathione S-transferase